jgi:hypothetical protein
MSLGKSRGAIVDAIVAKLKTIDGSGFFNIDLSNNVENKLVFWDELNDFPFVSVVAGSERREYLPGNFKWGFLNITVRMYVYDEDPVSELEKLLVDTESVIDSNRQLNYATGMDTTEILIAQISSDEGLLAPYGVGEMNIIVQYEVR